MHFFAIQFYPVDSKLSVAEVILRKAEELGVRFKTLEALDVTSLGSSEYLRFRADLTIQEVEKVLNALYSPTLSVILPGGPGGYLCKMKNGRTGVVPFAKMQIISIDHPRGFRGNALAHWERQFLKDGTDG
jgi:hypothetical protein